MSLLAILLMLVGHLPFSARAAASDELFTAASVGIFTLPELGTPPVGRLLIASRLEVLERRKGWVRARILGWNQQSAARVLYAMPGKRIMVAALSPSAVERLSPLEQVIDPDTELTWQSVAFEGWIEDTTLVEDLDILWSQAWDLFATRCTVCHVRRIPEHYTANQWVSYLKIMGPRTGLPKDNQHLILKYLQNHAKDTLNGSH
ncbi:hypothetical protein JCM17960_03030 [Magnetospira thiophila]